MLDRVMAAMNTTENGFDYAQGVMDCTMRLTRAQLAVMRGLCDEVGEELGRTVAAAAGQAALTDEWPRLLGTAARANVDAGTQLMRNAQEFQSELLHVMRSSTPALSGQLVEAMLATNEAKKPATDDKKGPRRAAKAKRAA